MQIFEERALDGRLDVAHYVFENRTAAQSALAASKYFVVLYLIMAQVSVMLPLTVNLEFVAVNFFSARVRSLLADLWSYAPKGVTFVLFAMCLYLYRHHPVQSRSESFLIMRSLGVQTTSRGTSRFIPTKDDKIEDIIIHEGFKGFEVRFYLAILLKKPGPSQIEVVFPDTLPRRRSLEIVWRGAKQVLSDASSMMN